jgi:glycosyltransferase involved in cell wall biosynthesis
MNAEYNDFSRKSEPPAITVIVPLYNGRAIVERTLKAIRAQRGFAPAGIEIVVVDDGSTDGGAKLAAPLCHRLLHQPNLGAAAARNRGATDARAEILVFVDADVVLEPGALFNLYRTLADDPAVAAAVGRYAERPATPGFCNLYHNAFTRFHHDLSSGRIDWFWGALGAVRKSAFWAAGAFEERYRGASAEDMELGASLTRAGFAIVYCPDAEGAHAHSFSLAGMLANDYKKAVLGMKLRLMRRLPRRAPGFASPENIASAILLPVLAVIVLLGFIHPGAWLRSLLVVAVLAIVNNQYYRFLWRFFPGLALVPAVLLHWTQLLAITAGAAAGILGRLLGREAYGPPGWI